MTDHGHDPLTEQLLAELVQHDGTRPVTCGLHGVEIVDRRCAVCDDLPRFVPATGSTSRIGDRIPTRAGCSCGWAADELDPSLPDAYDRWLRHTARVPSHRAAIALDHRPGGGEPCGS